MAVMEELVALFLVLLLLLLPAAASGEPAHPGYAHAEVAACGVAEAGAPPERREEFDGGRIIDISHYYRDDMPSWESSEGMGEFLRLARSMRNGSDIANFSELRLTAHSGTHVDAPGHVFQHHYDAGFDVDTLDLAVLNGTHMSKKGPLVQQALLLLCLLTNIQVWFMSIFFFVETAVYLYLEYETSIQLNKTKEQFCDVTLFSSPIL